MRPGALTITTLPPQSEWLQSLPKPWRSGDESSYATVRLPVFVLFVPYFGGPHILQLTYGTYMQNRPTDIIQHSGVLELSSHSFTSLSPLLVYKALSHGINTELTFTISRQVKVYYKLEAGKTENGNNSNMGAIS